MDLDNEFLVNRITDPLNAIDLLDFSLSMRGLKEGELQEKKKRLGFNYYSNQVL